MKYLILYPSITFEFYFWMNYFRLLLSHNGFLTKFLPNGEACLTSEKLAIIKINEEYEVKQEGTFCNGLIVTVVLKDFKTRFKIATADGRDLLAFYIGDQNVWVYMSRVGGNVNRIGIKWQLKFWPGGTQNWNNPQKTTQNELLDKPLAQIKLTVDYKQVNSWLKMNHEFFNRVTQYHVNGANHSFIQPILADVPIDCPPSDPLLDCQCLWNLYHVYYDVYWWDKEDDDIQGEK
ncbi:hypothetical protein BC830DRAFT_1076923 [Chytriomyces sp. MP71]|nr:hypothetical protein BC830DRAFT_1076923 [Chytriomyces sp. MP71]